MKRLWPAAWVLVLTGLVLNILAILLSSIVLDKLSSDKAQLSEQKAENLYSIQLAWNGVETLERKREALLLHLQLASQAPLSKSLDEALRGQLAIWVGDDIVAHVTPEHLPALMVQINAAQRHQRERIDDFYLQNLSLNERTLQLEERIAFYKNIALFLQIFGLALILARDLARQS